MIRYNINSNLSLSIIIRKEVSTEEMEDLAFNIGALVDGNQRTPIQFHLEKNLSIKWVKYVERLCEDIPNPYRIVREPIATNEHNPPKNNLDSHDTF